MNKPRKPWLAGIFTLVSTGLGHIYTGKAKRGIVLFFIDQLVFIISTSLSFNPSDNSCQYYNSIFNITDI